MPEKTSSDQPLSFGVMLWPNYQLLDAAGPVDYINSMTREFVGMFDPSSDIAKRALRIQWHYISSTGTLDPVAATSGPLQLPSTTFVTCPPLDYLIVPGPDPRNPLSEACIKFIQTRFAEIKGLLTVCTGSIVLAQTGILDGLRVASNKVVLKWLAELGALKGINVKWVGDRRFVQDGKVWSAAGVTAGIDLAAEWARVHVDEDVRKFVGEGLEYIPNPAQPDAFAYLLEGVDLE